MIVVAQGANIKMGLPDAYVLIAGGTGAGEDNGAHWALPNAHIGTVKHGIENERRRKSNTSGER